MSTPITVQFVSPDKMSYETLDDYKRVLIDTFSGPIEVLEFKIVDTGSDVYNKILLIHALVEELIATAQGVTHEEIDQYDLAYKGEGEPGEEADCPYRNAHITAKGIEMILCGQLGIPWNYYERRLMEQLPEPSEVKQYDTNPLNRLERAP